MNFIDCNWSPSLLVSTARVIDFRQQNLDKIPQSIFLPAHVAQEREMERQAQMERRLEDMFRNDDEYLDLIGEPPLSRHTHVACHVCVPCLRCVSGHANVSRHVHVCPNYGMLYLV